MHDARPANAVEQVLSPKGWYLVKVGGKTIACVRTASQAERVRERHALLARTLWAFEGATCVVAPKKLWKSVAAFLREQAPWLKPWEAYAIKRAVLRSGLRRARDGRQTELFADAVSTDMPRQRLQEP